MHNLSGFSIFFLNNRLKFEGNQSLFQRERQIGCGKVTQQVEYESEEEKMNLSCEIELQDACN